MTYNPVRSIEWVAEHLTDPQLVLVDCRFALGRSEDGRAAYAAGHLPGAVYLHLEDDLSGPIGAHGGRHPLPDVSQLSEKIGRVGIEQTSIVVAYDEQGGAMASRLWWLLTYLGHEQVYVLDGGFGRWKEQGLPVKTDVPTPTAVTFIPRLQPHLLADMEDVRRLAGRPGVALLDSREINRYKGLEEPIDPVAGHIPGAQHAFWKDSLTEHGTFKSPAEQQKRFSHLHDVDEIIVYCGSGVTACPNILALRAAGFTNVKLYAGSWSDWVSYAENPVKTTKEEG